MVLEQQAQRIQEARELEVYKLAFNLSVRVHRATLAFPKMEQYALADQLRRATKSICANLAEGFDRQQYSKPEFRRFLMMASSSCAETLVWLDYGKTLEYISENEHAEWADQYDKVGRMLHKLRRKMIVDS